jgi:hypothetical protein
MQGDQLIVCRAMEAPMRMLTRRAAALVVHPDDCGIEQLFRFRVRGRVGLELEDFFPLKVRLPRFHQPFLMRRIRRGYLQNVLAQGDVPSKTFSPSEPSAILVCQLINYRVCFSRCFSVSSLVFVIRPS